MSENVFNLMKLSMGRYPTVDAEVRIDSLIDACNYFYEKNDAIAKIVGTSANSNNTDGDANAIYISDLKNDKDHFSILLVRGDPSRALPSFVNTSSRTVKTIMSDDPNDVPGASSHIIISKQEIASGSDQGRHRMVMERTRGIGRALAKTFLAHLLDRYAKEFPEKFIAEKKRKSKKEKAESIEYRPTVSFNPQQNGSLKKDLEDGKIGGFKLVRGKSDFQGEAEDPKIQKLSIQLTAKIVPTAEFSKVRSLIDHIKQSMDGIDFEALNLELVDEAGIPTGNTKSIALDKIEEADMRYCKTIAINGLTESLNDCYAKFYMPIVAAAKDAIQHEKHWK